MPSWHLSLWLLIIGWCRWGPCCSVVRTRCPELDWWFSAAANGNKRRIGNLDYGSWYLFKRKNLGAQMGISWAHTWSPASPLLPVPQVIRLCRQRPPGHTGPFAPCTPHEALPPALPSSKAPQVMIRHWFWAPLGLVLWILQVLVPNLLTIMDPSINFFFLDGFLVKDFAQQAVLNKH